VKQLLRVWPSLLAAVVVGCSTGPFLRPEAASGSFSAVNPACPGAQEVIEFTPQSQYWVVLRVYATLPGQYGSRGTELRVHFWFRYLKGSPWWSVMFPTPVERNRLFQERSRRTYLVTVSKPTVTIVLPDGSAREIPIPIFSKPYDPKNEGPIDFWANGVQVSPEELDSFTAIFPEVYVNGERLEVSPIQFKKAEDRYAPVLNC